MSITNTSRFRRCKVVVSLDARGNPIEPPFVDIEPSIEIKNNSDSQEIVCEAGDTWGVLGFQFLRDPTAWWAIAEYSGIIDPFTELEPGTILTTPSPTTYHLNIMGE